MPTQCTATTRTGPCRAWAVRGTDPPLCAAHAGRTAAGAGAPKGNQNAVTAGFYSRALRPDELADLVALASIDDLNDEIGAVRVTIRRVLEALDKDPNIEQLAILAAHLFSGARTVARLLRDRRVISGAAAEGMVINLTQILEELGDELGGQFLDPK